ncbi:cyclic pyranopterin monophosphate synthase MoaC [Helicobacter monodelphidis]|uniref:cyclic pyranopterin monophosphate synthase MoaC n=1 Tax=Helicobacter sp. 15-1451 TaxID=2004995 RepID=UPI0011BE4716|nr:cyclic pyranopterin monophosphate synthase MoaC [Helicobacter sp. 15-1451]
MEVAPFINSPTIPQTIQTPKKLTHLNANLHPTMVDVSHKESTIRKATACGKITMSQEAFLSVVEEKNKKGPVLQTAIIAAIMGAKKTSDLIPMCHPLLLSGIECNIKEDKESCAFWLFVEVKNQGNTGVEMEALSGVSIGLLTIYDMVKAIDKEMCISDIMLLQKSGGKSGDFVNTHIQER